MSSAAHQDASAQSRHIPLTACRPGSGQAVVCHLGFQALHGGSVLSGHQHVARLHVLMHQTKLMQTVQPPGELDGNVQYPLQRSLRIAFIQLPTPNPLA